MRVAALLVVAAACVQAPRTDTVATAKAVDEIEVRAEPDGVVGWTFAVKNRTGDQIAIVWDESTFVGADGVSRGRLIRGKTRRINDASAQPASPVAPGATMIEWAVPDTMLDKWSYVEQVPQSARRGTIRLVIQAADRKLTWEGKASDSAKPRRRAGAATAGEPERPLFCAGSSNGKTIAVCGRGEDDCLAARAEANGTSGDLGICERVERAFCFDAVGERGKAESCHPTPKSCETAHAETATTIKNVGACRIRD